MEEKKRVFSAIKPTGRMTIGNYIGALKNMTAMQEEYDCFFAVADLHCLTVDILPATVRENSLEMFALFLALGLSPAKGCLFLQSHVSAHSELTWVLNCHTQFGEARRMTQFKEKSVKAPANVNVGLFDYPVLMAADILLYQTDVVPVGKDQQQHLELARTIAQRFNNKFSPTFKVPSGFIPKQGEKIASLLDPVAKMGKTDDNEEGTVFILDSFETVARKFKRAVTDSGNEIRYGEDKPGVSNLLTIYAAFRGESVAAAERHFAGAGYAALKSETAAAVIEFLRPVQAEYAKLRADKGYLAAVMKQGAERAGKTAGRTLSKVYRKIGLVEPLR